MFREGLLRIAQSKRIERFVQQHRFTRDAARRFVAGETLAQALHVVRDLNARGVSATIAYVGEHATDTAHACAASALYGKALGYIAAEHLSANVSLKLTQLGLDIGGTYCEERLEEVAKEASRRNNFVRIDMESSAYTDRALKLCQRMHERHHNTGPVIQSYLYRSEGDVRNLLQRGIRVRLCKGAYREGPREAFQRKAEVGANFVRLMRLLLENGNYHAIATHDPNIITAAKVFTAHHAIPKDTFEFQMLYGIRTDLQQQLVREGYAVRIYVPFGEEWFGYFMRRLAERPANLLFFLSHVFNR